MVFVLLSRTFDVILIFDEGVRVCNSGMKQLRDSILQTETHRQAEQLIKSMLHHVLSPTPAAPARRLG